MELNVWQLFALGVLILFVVGLVMLINHKRRLSEPKIDVYHVANKATRLLARHQAKPNIPFPFPEAHTCRNCKYSLSTGPMGCLIHADSGRSIEVIKIKNALETHQCDEFKHRSETPPCSHCTGLEGEVCYPQYGVAPHECYYKIPGAAIGESRVLPTEQWPDNFVVDPDNPGCGVWFCPACKRGMEDAKTRGLVAPSKAYKDFLIFQKERKERFDGIKAETGLIQSQL